MNIHRCGSVKVAVLVPPAVPGVDLIHNLK
jgi:hypothetical protein